MIISNLIESVNYPRENIGLRGFSGYDIIIYLAENPLWKQGDECQPVAQRRKLYRPRSTASVRAGVSIQIMITVNGRQIEHGKKITVERLLRELKYTFPLIVVRVNGKIIPKEKYNTMVIHNGDLIDVIHLIAGG